MGMHCLRNRFPYNWLSFLHITYSALTVQLYAQSSHLSTQQIKIATVHMSEEHRVPPSCRILP